MKKWIYIGLMISFFYTPVTMAQKVISGKSKSVHIKINSKYTRGLPPNLFVNLSYEDANNNGILEPNEISVLKLTITNKGKGAAQGLHVKVTDNNYDPELHIQDGQKIPFLLPDKSTTVSIPIKAGFNIETKKHKLEIQVTEYFGYDMDPAYLVLNTIAYRNPELVFSGLEVIDKGTGTASIVTDGKLQRGEQVQIKIVVQNIGQNISEDTRYAVTSTNNNIYIENNTGKLGNIDVGEVKEFWITVSPNKRVKTSGKLPLFLSLYNKYKRGSLNHFNLPVELNQKPPEPEIVEVKPDVEQMNRQVARFEYTSNKITTNIENIVNINVVPYSKMKRPNSVAVVIGIENYKYFAPAPYAANDAVIFAKYLKQVLGVEKVYVYTNREVSGYFFQNIFNPDYGELQKAIIKGKTDLFVFYSGHGMPSKDGEKVYLFPSDGRVEALSQQGYNINQFYENLEKLNAKTTTVFIDACFSGVSRPTETQEIQNLVAMKGVSIKPKVEQPWETNPNFCLFSSSQFNETSLGFDPSKTGLFTYYVCAGLQGEADLNKDGKITTGELGRYVKEKVTATSVKILGKQTPLFNGNSKEVLTEY
jgi:hypothetical protein